MSDSNKEYMNSLARHRDFIEDDREGFRYRFIQNPEMSGLFARYGLPDVSAEPDTMRKARRVMQWVADNSFYDGASPLGPRLPEKILRFAFDEKNPINCANRSVLFTDALISLGIFAMPVWLENRTKKHTLSHVIAQVWLPEEKCWTSFDPSFNTCYTYCGRTVDIPTMAQAVRKAEESEKIQSVSNETEQPSKNIGLSWTLSGLLDISVFPGNDFSYRYRWEDMLHLLPLSCNDPQTGLYHIPTDKIIGLPSLIREPFWVHP